MELRLSRIRLVYGIALSWLVMLLLSACQPSEGRIVYVTATPGAVSDIVSELPTEIGPVLPTAETPNETTNTSATVAQAQREHVIQPGDTLTGIALANNTTVDTLMALNGLDNPDIISVGQALKLPELPSQLTPEFKIIMDSLLVRGPGSAAFNVEAFINTQPGYIRMASDTVPTRLADGSARTETLDAAAVVNRVSLEFGVDARLLLALLEYRAQWLSNQNPAEALMSHPMISEEDSGTIDRSGLYRQLAWTANEVSRGYYGWKYDNWIVLEFEDGQRLSYNTTLNAATVGLQHFLHLNRDMTSWLRDVSPDGFFQIYAGYFGNPAALDRGAPVPPGELVQPLLTLPFSQGEVWYFTGGPHGGWGNGSAWGAVDFAPPDDRTDGVFCYTSEFWVNAVAPGIIARSGNGVVVLDLDGDGDETTGWTVIYLHIAEEGRVGQGATVNAGDRIGHAACEGGFSTATHIHITRRYNGEWLPIDCRRCRDGVNISPFIMGGWQFGSTNNQEYQGYMQMGQELRQAEQGRNNPINRISW